MVFYLSSLLFSFLSLVCGSEVTGIRKLHASKKEIGFYSFLFRNRFSGEGDEEIIKC
jgi:hypothetical protein